MKLLSNPPVLFFLTFKGQEFFNVNNDGNRMWDIFRKEDVPKLEEYIRKHREEFRLIGDKPVPYISHAIHDQNFYLDKQHKARLNHL
ncbi:unnamed protein product [Calypogeia fissa]